MMELKLRKLKTKFGKALKKALACCFEG